MYASFEAKQGNYEVARDLHQRALSVDSHSLTTMHNRVSWASLEVEQGNLTQARTILRDALDLHPDFPAALVCIASVERKLRNLELAEAYVRRAMRVTHAFYPQAVKELQKIHEAKGDRAQAANLKRQFNNVEDMLAAKRSGVWASDAWQAYFDASKTPEQQKISRAAQQRKRSLGLIKSKQQQQQQEQQEAQQAFTEAEPEVAPLASESIDAADLQAASQFLP